MTWLHLQLHLKNIKRKILTIQASMGQNPQLHTVKDDQPGRKAGECGLQRENGPFIGMNLADVSISKQWCWGCIVSKSWGIDKTQSPEMTTVERQELQGGINRWETGSLKTEMSRKPGNGREQRNSTSELRTAPRIQQMAVSENRQSTAESRHRLRRSAIYNKGQSCPMETGSFFTDSSMSICWKSLRSNRL